MRLPLFCLCYPACVMRTCIRPTTVTTTAQLRTHAIAAPRVLALAVRPDPLGGQAQALAVCDFGVCPLHLNDREEYDRLEPPLALRNQVASKFCVHQVHDAVYDPHSSMVIFAQGSSGLYGMDASNRVTQLAGDEEGGILCDGSPTEARFVGAQSLATDGAGSIYIRDRDAASRNGFCLRTLQEASLPSSGAGSGVRAVVTIQTGNDAGPHALTYDRHRRSLLFASRGHAVHRLLPHGVTEELIGSDEPPPPPPSLYGAAAAVASASASDGSGSDAESDNGNGGLSRPPLVPQATSVGRRVFTNIQDLAANEVSGDVYLLDGNGGSTTQLRVLRRDGRLETLAAALRIGPRGSSRWPRLAVLPYGHLAVYGISSHDMMLVKL